MRPLKLEFEGINSFSEHTIIDFEQLIKNGIFGIFGDTGSGKSTILDCINFALYGRVERSKEKTDIINYGSAAAKVKFEFDMLFDGRRKNYVVERTLKKDRAGTHKATMYEDGVCVASKPQEVEKKVVEVIGLEAEDFRKCIALPQGEFAQFVKSTPSDRLALIQRLFGLSKYGDRLKDKINARQGEIDAEYQNISGKLSAYSDISRSNLKDCEDKKRELEGKLKAAESRATTAKKRTEELKNLYSKRLELDEVDGKLQELSKSAPEMEELKKNLAVLPVCREAVEAREELNKNRAKKSGCDSKLKELEEQLKLTEKRIAELEKQRAAENYDGKIAELERLIAKYDTCVGKPEKLKMLQLKLEQKREEYKRTESERAEIAQKKRRAEEELESLQKSVAAQGGLDMESLLDAPFKGAVLKEEYSANLCYFSELKAGIDIYREDTALYKYVDGEVRRKIEEYKQRVYDVKDFSLKGVTRQLENIKAEQKRRDELSLKIADAKVEVNRLDGQLKIKDRELSSLSGEGVEFRKRADELKEELSRVFGEDCKDFVAAVEDARKSLTQLKAKNAETVEKLEFARREKNETELEITKSKAQAEGAASSISELTGRIERLVAQSHMEDIEQCAALTRTFSDYPDAEKAIAQFQSSLSAYTHRKGELLKEKGIDKITEEELYLAENQSRECADQAVGLKSEIAVEDSNIKKLKQQLVEKERIAAEFARVESQKLLIDRLKEATKGNKFLEYIANEYLYDISSLATSMLLKLTDGRYFLTYSDNNFSVGDNFDCGNLRGVNTLSGGETFLVSLSLALALSQTICAKSLKSIEFFFLDEGFGTLDNSLVDVVMTALEKLKSSAFTIGVISHVEELKHRIEYQITVNKATESHGSTVRLSC